MDKSIKEFCTESQWDSILKWAETDLMMNEVNFETNFKHAKPFVLIQLMLQNTPLNNICLMKKNWNQ